MKIPFPVVIFLGLLAWGSGALAGERDEAIGAALATSLAEGRLAGASLAEPSALQRFYAFRQNAPAWDGQVDALLQAVDRAVAQGYRPEDFNRAELETARAVAESGDAVQGADFDILATDAAMRLVHHMAFGKVEPESLDTAWNFDRPVIERDPLEVFAEYVAGEGFAALMEQLEIRSFQYLQLVDALARYRALEASGGWEVIPEGEVLKPGMTDARVPSLRARLAAEGAEQAAPGEEPMLYDAALEDAIRAFQLRHGLTQDGAVGPNTLASLNQPVSDRIDKLRLSLERTRWYSRGLEEDFVLVNIAGAQTFVVLDGKPVWATRSITGSEYRQTPVFADEIKYMEVNPTWSVPASIFRKDKLARIRKDPGYLERNNYVVRNREGTVIPAASVNWGAKNPGVSLMQLPGPDNALGRIKFMFPNDHAVYLHDTNNRTLFDKDERNLSSGCVRIEDPFVLAGLLMQGDPSWTQARMEEILESGKTTRIDLPEPMPVLLTYWTAWVEDGEVQFREDPYERDAAVLAALNAAY
ncbi:L,D-transpeptidase family protein [Tropicimonas sp. TH_r6]|uniref:L,D-transpeptidase family protein n=1 Tax=Tropicimonas sp. TH_r6 TaxID=3082085 RepID=UPI002953ADFD|nr:L,D-transpeptidase family protein [Tropicimonas sp. TH_r6]MDV7143133.1 L,D-transpeptidase family protein [Tropicimonas sp. TH_r6]